MTQNNSIKLEDLPEVLKDSILDYLLNYSVGLYLEAQLIGTGTLIRCGKHFGILTAHHVVHGPAPPLDCSPYSTQELQLVIMERSHQFKIPAKYIKEIKIGVPISDEEGPDLTFLELLSKVDIGTLGAKKSFWNLDYNTDKRLASTTSNSGVLVITGLPEELEDTQKESEQKTIINATFLCFFGETKSGCRFKKNDFDFVDVPAVSGGKADLPSSFKGVSGGGLWKFNLLKSQDEIKWDDDPIFCGVAFYEQKTEGENLLIRCHYAESIYKKVRQSILSPSH